MISSHYLYSSEVERTLFMCCADALKKAMAKSVAVTKLDKIVYPSGCKELTEDLGKDDLIKRLKVNGSVLSAVS